MSDQSEFESWLNKLEEQAPEELKENVRKLKTHDGVKNFLKSGVMAQADYTRKTQEVANQRTQLEQAAQDLKKWWDVESPKNQVLVAELDRSKKEAERLKKLLVDGEELTPPADPKTDKIPSGDFVPRKDYEELVKKVNMFDKSALRFNLDLAKVQTRMRKENFDLDVEAVYDFAAKNGVDLVQAYDNLTAEERSKRGEAAIQKRIEEAREEGRQSALTKNSMPDGTQRDTAAAPLYREGISDPMKRVNAAVAAFMEAGKNKAL